METLGIRNNNPLNIRYSRRIQWRGQTGSNKGFCVFHDMKHGIRAALFLLCNYQRNGYDTIFKIVHRWAPTSENNTTAYINYVHRATGYPILDRIYQFSTLVDICKSMAVFESGSAVLSSEFTEAFDAAIEEFHYPEIK